MTALPGRDELTDPLKLRVDGALEADDEVALDPEPCPVAPVVEGAELGEWVQPASARRATADAATTVLRERTPHQNIQR